MKKLAEELLGACYYCMHSHDTEEGYWFCAKRRYKYFPEAEWIQDESDSSECSSYEPDLDLDDDYDDCDNDDSVESCPFFDKDCDPDEDMSGEAIFRGY